MKCLFKPSSLEQPGVYSKASCKPPADRVSHLKCSLLPTESTPLLLFCRPQTKIICVSTLKEWVVKRTKFKLLKSQVLYMVLANFEKICKWGIFGFKVHIPWKTHCFQRRVKNREINPVHPEFPGQCRISEKLCMQKSLSVGIIQNHRITERFWSEGTLKMTKFQTTCCGQEHFLLHHVA